MRALVVLTILFSPLLAGCATGYVASSDRHLLWETAIQVVNEQGFDVTTSNEEKGLIEARRSLLTDGEITERQHLTMNFEKVGDEYHATVYVKHSEKRPEQPAIERSLDFGRSHKGGTGRVAAEYGTVTKRNMTLEGTIRERMRVALIEAKSQPAKTANP
jgi:hypothetical protein